MLPGDFSIRSCVAQTGCYSHIFQELFHFWVVFRFDLPVVEEILLLAFMLSELEAVAVKGVFILVSSNVVDSDVLGGVRALISAWLTVAMVSE